MFQNFCLDASFPLASGTPMKICKYIRSFEPHISVLIFFPLDTFLCTGTCYDGLVQQVRIIVVTVL